MYDLGGLSLVNLGHGEPGTGKSMIIAAVATLLADHCKTLGIPFLFWPMPDTIVSTFQGGSAERMMKWMSVTRDPTRIIYAPIDDAENNLEERTRQGVSAGVREVIAVFLRNTEGAYAVHRGNCLIELYTNLPDQIDRAVMSRIIQRTYIGGAKDWHDFLDQDHLWWKRYRDLDPAFVGLADPPDYAYLADQRQVRSLTEVGRVADAPAEASIRTIFARVRGGATRASMRSSPSSSPRSKRNTRSSPRATSATSSAPSTAASWTSTSAGMARESRVFFRRAYEGVAMLRAHAREHGRALVRRRSPAGSHPLPRTTWCHRRHRSPPADRRSRRAAVDQAEARRGSRRRDAERRTGGRRGAGPTR
jgi:hypothetical protein